MQGHNAEARTYTMGHTQGQHFRDLANEPFNL